MKPRRQRLAWALVAAAALAAGCATPPRNGPLTEGQRLDPWEGYNRKVFAFNEGLDKAVLKPVATAYRDVVPSFVRTGLGNFAGNIQDLWSAVNHLLQGKVESGFRQVVRFGTNTSLGLLGVLDIASEAGIEKEPEDFGQTLGRWGVPSGIFIMWPVLGPSTVRDAAAWPLDLQATPSVLIDDTWPRIAASSLQLVDTRARLLNAGNVLDDIALDKYSFLRDAYIARRRSLVYDGDPPPLPGGDEADDATGAPAPTAADAPAPGRPASAPAR